MEQEESFEVGDLSLFGGTGRNGGKMAEKEEVECENEGGWKGGTGGIFGRFTGDNYRLVSVQSARGPGR